MNAGPPQHQTVSILHWDIPWTGPIRNEHYVFVFFLLRQGGYQMTKTKATACTDALHAIGDTSSCKCNKQKQTDRYHTVFPTTARPKYMFPFSLQSLGECLSTPLLLFFFTIPSPSIS